MYQPMARLISTGHCYLQNCQNNVSFSMPNTYRCCCRQYIVSAPPMHISSALKENLSGLHVEIRIPQAMVAIYTLCLPVESGYVHVNDSITIAC